MKPVTLHARRRISESLGVVTRVLLAGMLLGLFSACAPPPAYTVRLNLPLVPSELPPSALVVGVVDFQDARTGTSRLIGRRTDRDGRRQNIFLSEESVPGAVTTLFKSLLRKNNCIVTDIPAWRPAPDGSPSVPSAVDAVVSARIEEFSVTVDSKTLNTDIRYGLRFTAEIGIKGKDTVTLHTVKMEPRLTRPGFSEATLERYLNQYLAEALERLAEDILALQSN